MNKYLSTILISIFVLGFVLSSSIVGAEENTTANETSPQAETTKSIAETETASTTESEPVEEIPLGEQKFRVGPTVVLRPVNDVITKDGDGLVELYMDNPSLNDVTLNVDARISVPSGLHVYGQGFGQAGAAGTVYGTFTVPPGSARTISLNIKGDKTGTFTVHFSGLYWPGDNKDNYNPISLTHPFTVEEPSKDPEKPPKDLDKSSEDSGVDAKAGGSFSAPGFGVLISVLGLLAVFIAKRK